MEYCPHCMCPTTGARCTECGGDVNWKAPATQLSVGTLLRGSNNHVYQIGAAKGQGGFGITYAAMDLMSNRRVAIKEYYPTRCAVRDHVSNVVPATGQQDTFRGGMSSFLEEGRMLSAVGALPSVVSVRDYFEANGTAYIVMEYVDGLPLNEVVARQGRISEEQLMPLLKDLLRDLGILHRAGVIHRDISPDNLILTKKGTLKLLDFGSARSVQDGKSMTVMLKAGFSPVEQYQSKGQGPYTDVYALAGTIYYCLTGKIPPTAIDRISSDELESPNVYGAKLTREQEDALLWGLTVQPSARPQNVGAFAKAFLGESEEPIKKPVTGGGAEVIGATVSADDLNGPQTGPNTYNGPQTGPNTYNGPQTGPNTYNGPQTGTNTHNGPQTGPHTGTGGKGRNGGKSNKKRYAILAGAAVAVVALVVLLVSLLGGGTTEDGFKYKLKGDDAIIVGYEGDDKSVMIPTIIEDRVVVTIQANAFAGGKMTDITIPDSVTLVETNAFQNCTHLETVSIQGRNAELEEGAFEGCISLRAIIAVNRRAYDNVFESPAAGDLDSVALCYIGQELTTGKVQEVTVVDDVPFALTDSGTAVALLIPRTMSVDEIPSLVEGRRVFDMEGNRLNAVTGTDEDGFVYEIVGEQAYLVGYVGEDGIVGIPKEAEGKPIVEIARGTFVGNEMESLFLTANIQRIQPGAFADCTNLRDVYAYSEVQVPAGAFENCPRLRCLIVKNAGSSGWQLPEGCVVFNGSEDTGAGFIQYVDVDDNGVVYGITDQDEAVLMSIPAGISELTVPEQVYSYDVTWTHPRAFESADAEITVNMAPTMGFPFELFERANWKHNSFGDFSHSWLLSCVICIDVNDTRGATEPKMAPERLVVEAAMIRAREMNTSNSHDRPNGKKWSSVLDELEVDWDSGKATKTIINFENDDQFDEDFDATLRDLAARVAGPTDDGEFYVAYGAAMYYNSGRKTAYVNAMGIIRR